MAKSLRCKLGLHKMRELARKEGVGFTSKCQLCGKLSTWIDLRYITRCDEAEREILSNG